ncbi:MAG: hypothetical protein ACK5LZ_02100 [Anaerorhabdus sp.]
MKKVLENIWLCYGVSLLLVFINFISVGILFQKNPIINFLISLILLYIIYVLSFFLELLLIKIFNITKIKYLVLYPFSYDGRISFKPIILLKNQEMYRDTFWLNLASHRNMTDTEIRDKFKQIYYLRIVAIFLSLLLVAILIFLFFVPNYLIFINMFILFVLAVAFTFTNTKTYCGNGYILLYKSNLREYFILEKGFKDCDKIDFENYLINSLHRSDNTYTRLLVLENYLYYCFNYDYNIDLGIAINVIEENNIYPTFNLFNDVIIMSIIKLIGIYGLRYGDTKCVKYSRNILVDYGLYLLEIGFKEDGSVAKKNDSFINYLNGDLLQIDVSKHLIHGIKNIFSYIDTIEHKILNK